MISTSTLEPRELADGELAALLACSTVPVVLESHHAGWEKPWRALTVADWCDLRHEFGERVTGARVETGRNRATALRFGLEILPTVLVLVEGSVVARLTGRVRVAALVATVRAILEQQRAREAALAEFAAVNAHREPPSPLRTVLRRRSEPAPLVNVG